MKMPVVAYRKMSMNESVASTCCFRVVVHPTNFYSEVLHGGTLEEGALPAWISEIPREWAQLDFDVDFSGYTGETLIPFRNELLDGWWVLGVSDGAIVSAAPMDALLGDPGDGLKTANAGCAHGTSACLYFTDGEDGWLHKHSADAHMYGGDNWKEPHEAMQFNS